MSFMQSVELSVGHVLNKYLCSLMVKKKINVDFGKYVLHQKLQQLKPN